MTIIDAVEVAPVAPMPVGEVIAARGPFLTATGLPLTVGDGAACAGGPAEVIGFDGAVTRLIALGGQAVRPGDRIASGPGGVSMLAGDRLLGRFTDALGRPLDGLGPIMGGERRDVRAAAANPLRRSPVSSPLATGVRAIDALTTIGRGQRMILVAAAGVGKSMLIRRMMIGAAVDVVVIALAGERNREIADLGEALRASPARMRTIVVASAGDTAPLLRVRATERATAIAEHFRDLGRHVLLIVDSLTRVAHAQRELGLGLGEPPTAKGYPPSALAILPALLERVGNDAASGGSITAFYTVLADGDDHDDPVVDAARSIADGHITLSRALAERGVFPAIDVARSLSRVMGAVTDEPHRAAAAAFRRRWALAEANRELALMGAYREGADEEIDRALAQLPAMLDFIRQDAEAAVDPADARAALLTGFGA